MKAVRDLEMVQFHPTALAVEADPRRCSPRPCAAPVPVSSTAAAGRPGDPGRRVARAALERRESRGAHFRRDFPHADPSWRRRLFVRLGEGGTASAPASAESPPPDPALGSANRSAVR